MNAAADNNLIALGAPELALAAVLILLNAALSLGLRLRLERTLLVAAVRAVVQLLVLGLVLRQVFALSTRWAVLAMMAFMCLVAGIEAARRSSVRLPGLAVMATLIMTASAMLVTLHTLVFVLGVQPWYEPRYALPILGMLLGNTLHGISLGLDTMLRGLLDATPRVELLLAHGATPAQASRDVVRRAVRTGLIPILNAMSIAGLVSIPGMMTGQILSGSPPLAAARYQIMILFCIAGGVALGTIGMVLVARRLAFDERGRLRRDRLVLKQQD